MADLPILIDYQLPVITPMSPNSIGTEIIGLGVSLTSFTAWPSSNLALYIPFRIAYPTTIAKMFWTNSSTVGNNHVDVGVYDSQGNQLVHQGSTLTSGASSVQVVDITDTLLWAGLYYMAMACDGTTDTFYSSNTAAPVCASLGMYSQTSAFALPSTATFAVTTTAYIPNFGMTTNTTV